MTFLQQKVDDVHYLLVTEAGQAFRRALYTISRYCRFLQQTTVLTCKKVSWKSYNLLIYHEYWRWSRIPAGEETASFSYNSKSKRMNLYSALL